MKYLLDTHILLWAAGEPDRLSQTTRNLLLDENNTLFFSSANIWEIVIKQGIGHDDFKVDPYRLRKMLVLNDYRELPITSEHVLRVATLLPIHKDPFDRLLISQARSEGMMLLTKDSTVIKYGEGIVSAQ
jgi:PIN domain nuclease of toxin-antitoxin system